MFNRTAVGGVVSYRLKSNDFGDTLAVIPAESFVAFGSVLFRIDLEIVVSLAGNPVSGAVIPFVVSGVHSSAKMLQPTDVDGVAVLRVETRYSGLNTITPASDLYRKSIFDVTVSTAWYEAPFLITAYNCCDEAEFTGSLVEGQGIGLHKRDFLFSGKGIIMEGSGRSLDGRYIQIANPHAMRWNPGYSGVANPQDARFEYVESPQGSFGPVLQDSSIAIDSSILPPLHRVEIVGPRYIGVRRGDDTGGAIKGHHFDNFVGSGFRAMRAWDQAGGNIAQAKVKYLGV